MGLLPLHGQSLAKKHHGRSDLSICHENQLEVCSKDHGNVDWSGNGRVEVVSLEWKPHGAKGLRSCSNA